MKIKLTVELDLAENPALNVPSIKELKGGLQNLGSWLNELHLTYLEKITNSMGKPHPDPAWQEAILAHNQADAKVSEQLFNNYRIEGVTDDGHAFDFTHQEPGYKERMLIDGVETQEY